jgi:hypothetical protein
MPAWWDSIDGVTSVSVFARWAAGILGITAALFGLLALASSLKLDKLKAERDKAIAERQKDRRLTDAQRAGIKKGLEGTKGRIIIISMTDSIESHRYAKDFEEVLTEAGWTTKIQPILRISEGEPPTGLILAMENPQAIPSYINTLFKALENAGVPIEAQTAPKLIKDEPITLVVAYKP